MTSILQKTKSASAKLLSLSDDKINEVLRATADALQEATPAILEANLKDLSLMDPSNPKYDRLKLTAAQIRAIADDMRNVATLPSPRREIDRRVRPNGLEIVRMAVPFGVIGVIYEARPNVTADVFALCFKSGNACVLKGGHDAQASNQAIIDVIHSVLSKHDIDPDIASLLPPSREATDLLLQARGLIDVIIPRGSSALIESVREKAKIPVIETGAGVCHCYIDADADIQKAKAIVNNAKTRRVSVCNALDCVICHSQMLDSLSDICTPLADSKVVIYADSRSHLALQGHYPAELLREATDEDFGTEFLSYAMAIKTVDILDEALQHINRYGSGHSESVVTESEEVSNRFSQDVDAACVYTNAPTSWTDGAQFGLGAEIGISTQKLHARGPMGLEQLMTYKWIIRGNGQVRP